MDTAEPVALTTYNDASNSCNAYTGPVRSRETGAVKTETCLSLGYEAARIAYQILDENMSEPAPGAGQTVAGQTVADKASELDGDAVTGSIEEIIRKAEPKS